MPAARRGAVPTDKANPIPIHTDPTMTQLIDTAQAGSALPLSLHGAALHGSARLLVATTWVAGAVFAAYVVVFFGGVALGGLLAASAFVMMVTRTFTQGAWGRRMASALVQAAL